MIRELVSSAAMLLLAMGGTALAGDTGAVSSLKVGIDEVVEAGAVEAVDGVTSAGQPNGEALQVFSDSGYVAVIDLRGEGEDRGIDEQAAVEALGLDYEPLPILGREDISFENAGRLDALIEQYDGPVLSALRERQPRRRADWRCARASTGRRTRKRWSSGARVG